ncbi:fungal-specific transcription factor domain-containing protein [Exophiala viscosa]|uniref:fungal-specific transcription factor domain-containing protein n=1 Tax=Exophiala viscosa TaxID=2486360 RepID=UPI00218F3236|nr:fungal-specific transcription factor domain-containing protein [Exophiala viscosa]
MNDPIAQDPEYQAMQSDRLQKRKRVEVNGGPSRRSTNACHRCKGKKLKCHFVGSIQDKCAACTRAHADCVFDAPPDGVPRGPEYVASLEARVALLESELRRADLGSPLVNHRTYGAGDRSVPSPTVAADQGRSGLTARGSGGFSFTELVESSLQQGQKSPETTTEITSFNMLQGGPPISEMQATSLPELPSKEVGNALLETVYSYTQSRYCLVDWVRVREWHERREEICHCTKGDGVDSQTGAFFIWIIYSIGSGFTANPEYPPRAYFSHALKYLHAVLSLQNLSTVQALLIMCQYHFRVTVSTLSAFLRRANDMTKGGPSVWHLSGIIMRLCVELGYHRKAAKITGNYDPLVLELQKRFFWCAYSFDRLVSMIARRPFSIHDLDIDVELPVNVDVACTDREKIRDLQLRQAAGANPEIGTVTTLTSALHHYEMYRLRSRIITRLFGPHAFPPTYEEIKQLLGALDHWRDTAPQDLPPGCPKQSDERKTGFYLQAVLLVMRPVLIQKVVEGDLLLLCAGKAAEACENVKHLSLSPETQIARTDLYQAFYCGITLLQCLALQPMILPARRTVRAIVACSSTLAVYTRHFAGAAPFLELFEKLSDRFLGSSDDPALANLNSLLRLRAILQEIMSSDPSETSK